MNNLDYATELLTAERYADALVELERVGELDPHNVQLLNMIGFCWLSLEKPVMALTFFERAMKGKPSKYILVNIGRCHHEMGNYSLAMKYYQDAAELDPEYAMAYSCAGASLIQMSEWHDAEKCCHMALDCDPEDRFAPMNLASAQIAQANFKEGWDNFELSLGGKFRKEIMYGDETRWNGEKGKVVAVYGEQGLGDEIWFMQSANEMASDCKELHVDCDHRLEKLFQRSFPNIHIHGTRREECLDWLDGLTIDHRCAMASAMRFYRHSKEQFHGEPYLVADNDRRLMWRGLFKSWGKPVIGIATLSGTKRNNESGRTIPPQAWESLREKIDAVFISLDYKGNNAPAWAKDYPLTTRGQDIDDLAAMVSEMDCVIGVPQTALHLSAAVGTKTITLVPKYHGIKHSVDAPRMKAETYIYQGERTWAETIKEVAIDL